MNGTMSDAIANCLVCGGPVLDREDTRFCTECLEEDFDDDDDEEDDLNYEDILEDGWFDDDDDDDDEDWSSPYEWDDEGNAIVPGEREDDDLDDGCCIYGD